MVWTPSPRRKSVNGITPDLEAEGLAAVQTDGVTGHKVFLHLDLYSPLLPPSLHPLPLCGLGRMLIVGAETNPMTSALTVCFLSLDFHENIC